MSKKQKDIVIIDDYRIVKILNKNFTKKILKSFSDQPKTATEIANSISFPKEKIYYHLKNLLSNNILFIKKTVKVKGIEQKYFLPTGKSFQIKSNNNEPYVSNEINNQVQLEKENQEKINNTIENKNLSHNQHVRKIIDRRRNTNRRTIQRRFLKPRRGNQNQKFLRKNKRKNSERRINDENRINNKRRKVSERRTNYDFGVDIPKKKYKQKRYKPYPPQKITHKNLLLQLNGVKNAMTFVQSNNIVTFLYCTLKQNGFEIIHINNYRLPIKIKGHQIKTLPELIINIYNQFINPRSKKKTFLAIQSDNYQCEMTYFIGKGKSDKLFRKNIMETLNEAYRVKKENSLMDFIRYYDGQKNSTVCYSSKKSQIEEDYKNLDAAGIPLRYITSIPKILNNIYTYYNLEKNNKTSLLIYIGHIKTHTVFTFGDRIVESREIDKGLNFFTEPLAELSLTRVIHDQALHEATHFLSYYGLSPESSNTNIQDGFPFKKAKAIINHLSLSFLYDIKDSIQYFESILIKERYTEKPISKIFITGPGSHIKYLDKTIEEMFRVSVKNFSQICDALLKGNKNLNGPVYNRFKEKFLYRKQESSESSLKELKQKIKNHEDAIESTQSPESAKYSLARLEIEKNSKIKSIDSASKNLSSTAQEFKDLKEKYVKTQETLGSDLKSINSQVENLSEELIYKYSQYDEINKKISELEFEIDQEKNKKDKIQREEKNRYGSQIKAVAQSRAKLTDDKDYIEQEIDELESSIIKYQDLFHQKNYKIQNGQDEIAVFEYLKSSIQNVANIFKRSFLVHLKSLEDLNKDDVNTLQKAGYFITSNTKRIDEIRESFNAFISGETSINPDQMIDNENGIAIKEKLLDILSLVQKAPDDLIHLKNLSTTIVKINEDQSDLKMQKEKLSNQIIKSKNNIRENQGTRFSIKRDIEIHKESLTEKSKDRSERIDVLNYIRERIELNDEFDYHTKLLKEIQPQKNKKIKKLKSLNNQIQETKGSIKRLDQSFEGLEIENAEVNHSCQKKKRDLNDQIEFFTKDTEQIKNKFNDNVDKGDAISIEISNGKTYIDQLEKHCVNKKVELEDLNQKKVPIVNKSIEDKKQIIKAYEKKLKILDREQNQKTSKAQKTKKITIKAFFKKELEMLKKDYKNLEKSIDKIKKEKEKALLEKNNATVSLGNIKKKKIPQITLLKKQIKNWEIDIKRGRRIQERLDQLEIKKAHWDQLLETEQKNHTEQIESLEKSINRKSSDQYLGFLKDGLNRFNNDGNLDEIAKKMSQESIDLDLETINKLNINFKKFKQTHNTFLKGYKKRSKEILLKLKPFGGKKKIILAKIKSAKDKLRSAESLMQEYVNRLNKKVKILNEKREIFFEKKENARSKIADIKLQIRQIPEKENRAIIDVEKQLVQIPLDIAKDKMNLENQKKEDLLAVDIWLANQDNMLDINKAEDKIVYYFNEIEKNNRKIEELKNKQKKILGTKLSLEKELESISKKITACHSMGNEIEEQFKVDSSELKEKIANNRGEYAAFEKQLDELKNQKENLELDIEKIEKEFKTSDVIVKKTKKDISNHEQISDSININNNEHKSNPREYREYLSEVEKDILNDIEHSEKMITEINRALDTMDNDISILNSTINLNTNDLELYERDFSRVETLIENNKQHLKKISTEHQKSLNSIVRIKDLYPPSKIMLNERISNLYTLIELKVKDKDNLEQELDSLDEKLKNKRIEIAMIDQEISKIHEEMKHALEYSFHEKDEESVENKWKWEIGNYKMKTYLDIATLKTDSKDLYCQITEAEETIAELKQKQSSVNNLLSESEKINLNKIKKMEDTCTRLELQITREKNELNEIEKKVNQLENLPINYGNRIEALKVELRNFKDQEAEYELLLNDLGRSIESIEKESDKIIKSRNTIKDNTIDLDYMANLGLLMDPYSKLNLLPDTPKKDFNYFRSNQIFQRAILILVTVFSLGAFAHRTEIKPLKTQLPIKQSELTLLNMRQKMKEVVKNKNVLSNNFSKFIYDDEKISSDIVSLLKYLSKNIPKNYKVINLTIDKNKPDFLDESTDYEFSSLNITLNGFFENSLEKSSRLANKLKTSLEESNLFKSVALSHGKKQKKLKMEYTIQLVY